METLENMKNMNVGHLEKSNQGKSIYQERLIHL